MKMRKLPGSDLLVSELCLGTMTFGEQVTKEQAFQQLNVATTNYGINFLVSTHRQQFKNICHINSYFIQ
jgi:aryl-alcohol dehydrogenase-like predicted oxidoreductase